MQAEPRPHPDAPEPSASPVPHRSRSPAPACLLDAPGMQSMRARYQRLGRSLTRMQRDGELLVLEFGPDLDRQLLERALEVERGCCPFFSFSFAPDLRRLCVGVADPATAVALDAFAALLSGQEADA
jgi:hypothetical protein